MELRIKEGKEAIHQLTRMAWAGRRGIVEGALDTFLVVTNLMFRAFVVIVVLNALMLRDFPRPEPFLVRLLVAIGGIQWFLPIKEIAYIALDTYWPTEGSLEWHKRRAANEEGAKENE